MPPLQLLVSLPRAYPGTDAGSRLMRWLILGLRESGASVRVIALDKGSEALSPRGEDPDGTALIHVRPRHSTLLAKLRNYLEAPSLVAEETAREVARLRPDFIISYGQSYHQLAPLLRVARNRGVRLVTYTTEQWPYAPDLLAIATDNLLFRRLVQPKLGGIFAISQALVADAERSGVPVLHVPALGDRRVTTEYVRPSFQKPFNLTYIGPLFRRDLPDTLLRGFRLAQRTLGDIRLTVVGRVNSTKAGKRFSASVATDSELASRVEITGWVSDQQLTERMAEADAFVILRDDDVMSNACFPFRLSGFLLTGRPCVLSEVGELRRLFQHRKNAWLIPAGDATEPLSSAICHLARNPTEATRIGLSGRQTALDKLRYDHHGARATEFLAKVLTGGREQAKVAL